MVRKRQASPLVEMPWSAKMISGISILCAVANGIPTDSTAHYSQLTKQGQHANGQEAIKLFQDAINLSPRSQNAHILLASEFSKMGRTNEAIASWRDVIAIRPTFAEVYDTIGILSVKQKEWIDAIGAHSTAMALKPNNHKIVLGAANAYLVSALDENSPLDPHQTLARSIKIYELALALSPSDQSTLDNLQVAKNQFRGIPLSSAHNVTKSGQHMDSTKHKKGSKGYVRWLQDMGADVSKVNIIR